MGSRLVVAIGLVVAAACGADAPSERSAAPSTQADDSASGVATNAADTTDGRSGATNDAGDETGHRLEPTAVMDLADAIAVNIATNGTSEPVVAWTARGSVQVARLDVDSFTLRTQVGVSGELVPFAHPIERPAISIGPDEVVHAAFTSLAGANGTVQYVDVIGGTPTAPIQISGEPRPETNLVHMTAADNAPTLAWLEPSSRSTGGATPSGW